IAAVRKGEFLVRWTYTPTEWRRYCESAERLERLGLLGCLAAVIASLIAVVSALIAKFAAPQWAAEPENGKSLFVTAFTGVICGIICGLFSWYKLRVRRRRRAFTAAPPPTYIAREFVHFNDEMLPLSRAGATLRD